MMVFSRQLAVGLSALLFLLFSDIGRAQKIYKYKDENGVLRFSDRPPAAEIPVEVKKAYSSEPDHMVSVKKREEKGETTLVVVNDLHGPVEVEISLTERENVRVEPPLPERFVIPAASEIDVVKLGRKRPDKPFFYRYRYQSIRGDPGAMHEPAKPYRAPFQKGERHRISQAFNGKYSHFTPYSRHAVDFSMPEGTPVVCARSGVVMEVRDNYFWGGTIKSYYSRRTNLIRVLHDDGSMALYVHLKRSSIRVSPGEKAAEGQIIALSGNTGFSSGPHLHFVVQINRGMTLASTPIEFESGDGGGVTPKKGMVLEAF
ncbi:MAG: M23 family metallopeptidase [Desulfobacterales bacterium]|nr:M23 family metallopeptidase [Desulfobacterales bacterium]